MTFEITRIVIDGEDVTFFFNHDTETPFRPYDFSRDGVLRRRLERLKRRLIRWNNRNLVPIAQIDVTSGGCIFSYPDNAPLRMRLQERSPQRRIERMERVIKRWNAYYN